YAFSSNWSLANGVEAVVIRFDHLDNVFCSFSKQLRSNGVVLAVEFTFPLRWKGMGAIKGFESRNILRLCTNIWAYAWLNPLGRNMPRATSTTPSLTLMTTLLGVPNITYDNGIDVWSYSIEEGWRAFAEP
ncbi:MAG: hypothetical protein V8S24_07845, partial [Gordonibacter pamelaeae]